LTPFGRAEGGHERSDVGLKTEGFAPIPSEPQARRDVTEDVPTSHERSDVALKTEGFEPSRAERRALA